MKKNNSKAVSEAEKHPVGLSIAPGIAVISAVLLMLFVSMFFLLEKNGMLPSYLSWIFSAKSDETSPNASDRGKIRFEGIPDGSLSEENYFSPDFSDFSGSLDELTALLDSIESNSIGARYIQHIGIRQGDSGTAYSYKNRASENTTIYRDGEKYRIESDGKLIICDGEQVYSKTGLYEMTYRVSDRFTLENNAGTVSIKDIKAELKQLGESEKMPDFSYDDRSKVIFLNKLSTAGGIYRSYEISYETGLIISEIVSSSDGNVLYYMYTIEYNTDPNFTGDEFILPEN